MYELCRVSDYHSDCQYVSEYAILLIPLTIIGALIYGAFVGTLISGLNSRQKALMFVGIKELREKTEDKVVDRELEQIAHKLRLTEKNEKK